MPFVKLDCGIVDSTIWAEPDDVLRTWIALLAKANENGIASVTVPALAILCRTTNQRMAEILAIFESPDKYSRNDKNEGRRLAKIDTGYLLLNYEDYRARRSAEEKREADRQRVAKKRAESKMSPDVAKSRNESRPVVNVAQVEAEAEVEVRDIGRPEEPSSPSSGYAEPPKPTSRFTEFWLAYPKKVKRRPSEAKWKARRLDDLADRILQDIRERMKSDRRWLDGFVPDPLTYINQNRWEDEIDHGNARAGEKRRAMFEGAV